MVGCGITKPHTAFRRSPLLAVAKRVKGWGKETSPVFLPLNPQRGLLTTHHLQSKWSPLLYAVSRLRRVRGWVRNYKTTHYLSAVPPTCCRKEGQFFLVYFFKKTSTTGISTLGFSAGIQRTVPLFASLLPFEPYILSALSLISL